MPDVLCPGGVGTRRSMVVRLYCHAYYDYPSLSLPRPNTPLYLKLPSATLAVASLQKSFEGPRGHRGLGGKKAAAAPPRSAERAAEMRRAGAGVGVAQPGSVFAPLDYCIEDGGVERELATELRRQEELNEASGRLDAITALAQELCGSRAVGKHEHSFFLS